MITYSYDQVLAIVADEMAEQRADRIEYARMIAHGCQNPAGHIFLTVCGETKCRYCPRIAWQ